MFSPLKQLAHEPYVWFLLSDCILLWCLMLRLVRVKAFPERKMFSCVWLHFKKCFEKYFLVFGCVFENTIENKFSTCCSNFLTFSRLPNEYIISFISQYRNTNKTQKKNHQIRSNWEKKEEREATGFDEGLRSARCFARSRSARRQDRDWRGASQDRDRRGVSRDCDQRGASRDRDRRRDLSPFGCLWVVLSLSLSPFARLWAPLFARLSSESEGKIKTEIILQDQRTHFTVNGSYFPFYPIFRTNQTPTFPENHFRNQFEAKTNGA